MSETTAQETGSYTPDAAELEADIARHRAELADTIDQLAAKLDVKSRVRVRASRTTDETARRARALQERVAAVVGDQPVLIVTVAGSIIGFIGTGIALQQWKRRR